MVVWRSRQRVAAGIAVAGVAQLVERKPSKLDVAGSSPVSRLTGNRNGAKRKRRPRWRDWTRDALRFPVP